MKCKYCEAELEEDVKICPACGADLEKEEPAVETVAAEIIGEVTEEVTGEVTEEVTGEVTEEVTEETTEEATAEAAAASAEKKEKKGIAWQVVAIVACVVALVCLAIALLSAFGLNVFTLLKKEETEQVEGPADDAGSFVSTVDYTGTEEEARKASETVVATMNGVELTNRELQIYYSLLVNEFLTNYYQYLEQLGLDLTLDLNTQACYFDDSISWEKYFVDNAINTWKNYQAVAMFAQKDGFTLSEELQKALELLPEELEKTATETGYTSAEEMIRARVGGEATVADYVEYRRIYYIGAEYTNILPSDEELSAYFDEYAEMFLEYDITKESGPMVDVRHILIQPEGGTVSEDGLTTTYSDKEWKACKKEAEALLKEWKKGAATEESFAELANEHSEDSGSNTNGGLYTQITSETSFVEPFLTWCMDDKREVGDTDLVKSEYGYHIMYFSASEPIWLYYAKSQYISDRTTEAMETGLEKWPAEISEDKICLVAVDIA